MRRFLMGKTMTENFRPLTDEDINRLDELLATSSSGDDTFAVSNTQIRTQETRLDIESHLLLEKK